MKHAISRRRFTLAAGAAVLASALPRPALAQTPTRLKMILNWRYQGPQGWFFLADDRGYFREEGLEIVMDQGNGSGAAVGAVASGSYDIGFGDINALIQLVARSQPGAVRPRTKPARGLCCWDLASESRRSRGLAPDGCCSAKEARRL